MGSMSVWHWLILALVVFLLFGKGKISELMGDAAKGIKAFKKGMSEEDEAAQKAADAKLENKEAAPVAPATPATQEAKKV